MIRKIDAGLRDVDSTVIRGLQVVTIQATAFDGREISSTVAWTSKDIEGSGVIGWLFRVLGRTDIIHNLIIGLLVNTVRAVNDMTESHLGLGMYGENRIEYVENVATLVRGEDAIG